jgi:glycosyltransferase involved in cell wall biosynthesis
VNIALFTHRFLEPTHYAIAQVLAGLKEYRFSVFAKHATDSLPLPLPNVVDRHYYRKGSCPQLDCRSFAIAHAIFDGKTALRAADAARLAHLPFVVSFHGGFDIQAKIFDPRYTAWTRGVLAQAAAVTVVCAADLQRLDAIGIQRTVTIVPVPIDCRAVPPRGQYTPHSLIVVARLVPKKGVDIALQTLALLPRPYELTIVGDGHCRPVLEDLAVSLGLCDRVRWLGTCTLEQTLLEMSRAGALLHAARVATDGNAEGNPQTILWAQAMGLPVVTTSTGSIPSIVEDGRTGLLVRPESPPLLARAVRALLEIPNLSQRLTSAAKAQVSKHDLRIICDAYRAIYHSVLDGPSS